jgi:hypothetical protein
MSLRIFTHFLLEGYVRQLTLCMLAFWSHEGVVFRVFLPSPHLIMSFHLPCLGSTDAHCPRLGDPVPLPPKWRPFPQGLRTLPDQGSGLLGILIFKIGNNVWFWRKTFYRHEKETKLFDLKKFCNDEKTFGYWKKWSILKQNEKVWFKHIWYKKPVWFRTKLFDIQTKQTFILFTKKTLKCFRTKVWKRKV